MVTSHPAHRLTSWGDPWRPGACRKFQFKLKFLTVRVIKIRNDPEHEVISVRCVNQVSSLLLLHQIGHLSVSGKTLWCSHDRVMQDTITAWMYQFIWHFILMSCTYLSITTKLVHVTLSSGVSTVIISEHLLSWIFMTMSQVLNTTSGGEGRS